MPKAKKQKKPEAGTHPQAEITVEARDFLYDATRMRTDAGALRDCCRAAIKRCEKLREALEEHQERSVKKGPQAGLLFASVEESRQQDQREELRRLETAISLMNFALENVPIETQAKFRDAVKKASQQLLKDVEPTEPEKVDGKSAAAGEKEANNGKMAAG